jgi:hypothetical protein
MSFDGLSIFTHLTRHLPQNLVIFFFLLLVIIISHLPVKAATRPFDFFLFSSQKGTRPKKNNIRNRNFSKSYQAIDTVSNPSPAVLETAPAQEEETLTDSAVVPDGGPLLKTELCDTEKEKRLASFVTNAEATRKTAGAEGAFYLFLLSFRFQAYPKHED